jgi:hypothetical protein
MPPLSSPGLELATLSEPRERPTLPAPPAPSGHDELYPPASRLRSELAIARSLLDQVERLVPSHRDGSVTDPCYAAIVQLAEELAILGRRTSDSGARLAELLAGLSS